MKLAPVRNPFLPRRRSDRRPVLQRLVRALVVGVVLGLAVLYAIADDAALPPIEIPLAGEFEREVEPRLQLPADAAADYAARLQAALDAAAVRIAGPEFVVLVDRSPQVQAVLLYWGSHDAGWSLVGAAPVSTGLPGRYEHFATPLGVFEHSMAAPDFRAEGTLNENGIRGYGRKGSRVYDFGWIRAARGWGDGAPGVMRLQMHSTDPDRLEQRLGTAQSKGCLRIPARLNDFIDRRAVLDAAYDEELAGGAELWVLRADRTPTPWEGRYLVVIDSGAATRPDWARPSASR